MSKRNKSAGTPKAALPPAGTPETASLASNTEPGVTASPRPNIKFAGRDVMDRRKRKVVRVNDPIESYSDAGRIVKLPPADFQKRRRMFYHESAAEIAALFPHLYKLVRQRS